MPPVAKPWFRMYASLLTNRKVQSLKGGEVLGWLNLLALASVQRPRGSLPSLQEIAFQLRLSAQAAEKLLTALCSRGLIDCPSPDRHGYRVHDWAEWQRERDVAEGLRDDAEGKRDDYHANVTQSAEKVTPDQNREEIRSETEQKQKQNSVVKSGEPVYIPPVRSPGYQLLQKCFGRAITPMEGETFKALEEEHPIERIEYALSVASDKNARNLRFIQAVCEQQEQQGDNRDAGKPATRNANHVAELTDRDRAELDRYGVGAKREVILD